MHRSMNTNRLHAGDDDRYGEFRLGDEGIVVYDRENSDAWLRVDRSTTVER